ncbi:hypothetical protein DFH29DRAFT_994247 [Suillus ampliporus]|nr:hypothetical protein DFH29DRAFT_994247 [Suillus ampliporus]
MKKRIQPIEELEEKTVIGNKPSVKAAGKQPPAIAMCIHDGPPDVTKVRHAHPVAKGSQPLLTKAMHLLQEDEDLQNNHRAMCPETSVDRSPSAQVTEASILPVVPSSPHNSDHPVELTEDNGQSSIKGPSDLPILNTHIELQTQSVQDLPSSPATESSSMTSESVTVILESTPTPPSLPTLTAHSSDGLWAQVKDLSELVETIDLGRTHGGI